LAGSSIALFLCGYSLAENLKVQERARNRYWREVDHFLPERLKWRAEMVRHCFHLFPEDRILEVGCGVGEWTRVLSALNGDRNPICAATFDPESYGTLNGPGLPGNIEPVLLEDFPGSLEGRQFDFIVGWDLLFNMNGGRFLSKARRLLKPGGQILLFDPNPWNPWYNARHFLGKFLPFLKRENEGIAINRIELYSTLSEIGFIHIKIFPYDFVFPPVPRFLLRVMQNLSLVLENFPYVRNFAGSLYIWAQRPAADGWKRPMSNLARHEAFHGKVSVVVPCRNEAANIPTLVENLRTCFNPYLHEIILVDDNSQDETAAVGERLAGEDPRIRVVRRAMPNGVGRALRDGFAAATGEYLLTMDCDFQHIVPEMTGLFDGLARGNDVVIGSRFSRNSVLLNYAFTKILANRGFHILANLLLGIPFRDATNNLKLMKIEVARKLEIEFNDFAANAETGLKPILMGYKVEEVPISWIDRSLDMGLSKFNLFKTGPNYAKLLSRLVWRKWVARRYQA